MKPLDVARERTEQAATRLSRLPRRNVEAYASELARATGDLVVAIDAVRVAVEHEDRRRKIVTRRSRLRGGKPPWR